MPEFSPLYALLPLGLWMSVDIIRFRRRRGGLRRGLPVWITRAPEIAVDELRGFAARGPDRHERDWGWFAVDGDQALVMAKLNPGRGAIRIRRTSWPYLLRVRLDDGRMEYRAPVSSTLFLLGFALFPCLWVWRGEGWSLGFLLAPVWAVFLAVFNHHIQKGLFEMALTQIEEPASETP